MRFQHAILFTEPDLRVRFRASRKAVSGALAAALGLDALGAAMGARQDGDGEPPAPDDWDLAPRLERRLRGRDLRSAAARAVALASGGGGGEVVVGGDGAAEPPGGLAGGLEAMRLAVRLQTNRIVDAARAGVLPRDAPADVWEQEERRTAAEAAEGTARRSASGAGCTLSRSEERR